MESSIHKNQRIKSGKIMKNKHTPTMQNNAIRLGMLLSSIIFSPAILADQWVTTTNDNPLFVAPGEVIDISPEYSVTSPQEGNETGLGLRLHFDSQALEFQQLTGLSIPDSLGSSSTPRDELNNEDEDDATDQYLSTGWFSIGSQWPGTDNLPLTLYTASFQIKPDSPIKSTLNFSASSHDARANFRSDSLDLCLKPTVSVALQNENMQETDTTANLLTFTLSHALPTSCGDIELTYQVAGSAVANQDYAALPGVISIPAGELQSEQTITLINDAEVEENEQLTVNLQTGAHYLLAPSNDTVSLQIISEDQDNSDQSGTDQGGTDQGGTDQGGTDQDGTDQDGTDQDNTDQDNTDQGGTDQDGTDQDNTDQGSTDQGSTDQGSTDQDGTDQDGTDQSGSNEDDNMGDSGESMEEAPVWLNEPAKVPTASSWMLIIMSVFLYFIGHFAHKRQREK
jgi:hypothetical protein